jgi:farnesyl-diphosphate farnesyltransferase
MGLTRVKDSASLSPSLNALLKDVSRSFYLTLRILPAAIREPIGLAYLLARATDTIADTDLVPVDRRLQALNALRRRILGEEPAFLDLSDLACRQGNPAISRSGIGLSSPLSNTSPQSGAAEPVRVVGQGARGERILLERIEDVLAGLARVSTSDQERVRDVLTTITGGQELDLKRFGEAGPNRIVALRTDRELDDYTYRVAGCVGEFWTRMCRVHLFPEDPVDEVQLFANGVRFGQGLQLVNILRDLAADLRLGRCYLPEARLQSLRLTPADLVRPETEPAFRPLYDSLLDRAQGHLAAGWEYTCALPGRLVRVRLACAWPLLIGVKTLDRLRHSQVLDPRNRVKVSRAEVRSIMMSTFLRLPWPGLWKRLFAPEQKANV